MGCGCGVQSSSPSRRTARVSTISYNSECDYTTELMLIWRDKLNCIKAQNLFLEVGFNKYKINFAIGTVQSAINTGNACLFKRQLDEINNIILSLINIEKC